MPMLYARSDLMSVSVPVTSGGCGHAHARPVNHGAPAKIWGLECPRCEHYLRGGTKPQILKTTPGDPKAGIASRQERVADADPHWSSTPESVPLTPDEVRTKHVKVEKGEQQLRALESLITLKSGGIDLMSRPEIIYYLRESGLPMDALEGKVVCSGGHDNPAGTRFCAECGVPMNGKKAVTATSDEIREKLDLPPWGTLTAPIPPEPVADTTLIPFQASHEQSVSLAKLHVATLKKMCRQKGLPDKGTKDQLIARLK